MTRSELLKTYAQAAACLAATLFLMIGPFVIVGVMT